MEISVSFPGNARVDASFDGFVVHTDQAPEAGGDGSAPSPFELFFASLGACAGVYLLRFLQQRHLSPAQVSLSMRVEFDTSGLASQILYRIGLPPDFPEKYVIPLVRAVEHCTVKRQLHRPPSFVTSVWVGERLVHESQT